MKRAYLLVLAAVLFVVLLPLGVRAQEFSKPILIGGENSKNADKDLQQKTEVTSLKFFVHPKPDNTSTNFADDQGKIEVPNFDPMFADDVVGLPGYAPTPQPVVNHGAEILDTPTPRAAPSPLSPDSIGPDDLILIGAAKTVTLGVELMLEDNGNIGSHRLMLGDIREETSPPDETDALFGLADALEPLLIGNAGQIAPYTPTLYPSAIIAGPTAAGGGGGVPSIFKWCSITNPVLPWSGYTDCAKGAELGKNEYKDVFIYDVGVTENGFVSAAYDPFLLKVDRQWYLGLDASQMIGGGLAKVMGDPGNPKEARLYAYYSPLTLFRKSDDGASKRYRFGGYSSWEMPTYKNTNKLDPYYFNGIDLWPFIFGNWILPVATNPIAVDTLDLNGESSWIKLLCKNQPGCKATDFDHPDSDVAVAYQTTLFDLDKTVFDKVGRPAVFSDNSYHTMGELVGTDCVAPQNCPAFAKLDAANKARFPDRVVSLVLFWRQQYSWAVGDPKNPYVHMNPSHVFEPSAVDSPMKVAIVGPGVYDIAVLTDYADTPLPATKRNQHVLVPSVATDSSGKAVIYDIHKDSKEIWFHAMYAKTSAGGQAGGGQCSDENSYKPTPFLLPDIISIDKPPAATGDYVPYRISVGNIDGDACEDFLVTWRGKNTIADPNNAGYVKFDDGNGKMFSNRVTIVLRKDNNGTCEKLDPAKYPNGIPASIDYPSLAANNAPTQITSAAIGDFNGDNVNDIVAGDQILVTLSSGAKVVYAYFLSGATNPPFSAPGSKLDIPVNVKQGGNDLHGVAVIEADHTKVGADAIGAINSLPLMLPPIGCPDNANANDPRKGAIFETYVSLFADLMAQDAAANSWPDVFGGTALPFVDKDNNPIPQRCAAPRDYCGSVANVTLPFYKDDPCCTCNGGAWTATDWDNKCKPYLVKYGSHSWCAMKQLTGALVGCKQAQNETTQDNAGFASNWQPDQVVSEDKQAIAAAQDLIPADIQFQKMPLPLIDMLGTTLNLLDLLAQAIIDTNASGAQDAANAIKADPNLIAVSDALTAYANPREPYGPPESLEDYFLKNIASGIATNFVAGAKPQPGPSCSLIASVNLPGGTRLTGGGGACNNDGTKDPGEMCDTAPPNGPGWMQPMPVAPPTPLGCPLDQLCDKNCTCHRAICGDGYITKNPAKFDFPQIPDEPCDTTSQEPNNGCPQGFKCKETPFTCVCEQPPGPPPPIQGGLNLNVKLPIGQLMPDHHEAVAVLWKNPAGTAGCNYDGIENEPPEECDVAGVPPALLAAEVKKQCANNPPPNPNMILDSCNMNNCTCKYVDPVCAADPNSECNAVGKDCPAGQICGIDCKCHPPQVACANDPNSQCNSIGKNCPAGQYCDVNCTCHDQPPPGQPGQPVTEVSASLVNDCFNYCTTYSGDPEKELYKKVNDDLRAVTGRPDDYVCEPEQRMMIIWRVASASLADAGQKGSSINLSLSSLPDRPDKLRPFTIIQSGGSKFLDTAKLPGGFKSFELVTAPLRLLPVEAQAGGKAIMMPDLSASADLSALAGAAEMSISSLSVGADGAVNLNNMFNHRVISVAPGQAMSLGGGFGKAIPQAADVLPGAAVTVHVSDIVIPPDWASWTGVEGYAGAPNIEDRTLNLETIKNELKAKVQAGTMPTCAIYQNNTWDKNLNYNINLVQSVFGKAGEPEPAAVNLPDGFLGGPPTLMGVGGGGVTMAGGCKCNMAGASAAIESVVPAILVLLVPAFGIAVRRRMKRR